jgi:hypothetical protein
MPVKNPVFSGDQVRIANQQMTKLKKTILYTITIPGLLIIFVVLANYHSMVSKGTNVAFQSSDGKWATREVLMKGYRFDDIVIGFVKTI